MADDPRPILKVGLTGGIASGKSTVAAFFAEQGAFVIDADRLAHEVMNAGGAAHEAVVDRFGREIVRPDGTLDRPALGKVVFHDDEARADLNAIVHPVVLAEADRRMREYHDRGHAPIAVFDAPLIVESGHLRDFHRLIVVRCSVESQLLRLTRRDGLSEEEALARIHAQAPLEEKLKVADYVVDTEGTVRESRAQAAKIYASLLVDLEREFGAPGDPPPFA